MTITMDSDKLLTNQKGRDCDARTVLQQIGANTRMAIGLRDVVDLHDGIMGRVLSGNRLVKLIVKLNASDTYDVQLVLVKRKTFDVVVLGEASDVYCDVLGETCYRLTHAEGVGG